MRTVYCVLPGYASSPIRTYSDEVPESDTFSRRNRACWPKTLPVLRWQARQWQMETRTGSPTTWAVS